LGEYPLVGATEKDLRAFMELTTLVLPPEIQAFCKITKGLAVRSLCLFRIKTVNHNGTEPTNDRNDGDFIYAFMPEFQESGWLPIGTDGCGN